MEKRQGHILGGSILAGIFWLGLHLFVAVRNFGDSLYETFDGETLIWIGIYNAALLLLDVLLFFLNSRSAAKKWLCYWCFCVMVGALLLLCQQYQVSPGLWAIFPMAAGPFLHCDPLWRMVFHTGSVGSVSCTLVFCIAHVTYFFRLTRRGSGEDVHGSVDL